MFSLGVALATWNPAEAQQRRGLGPRLQKLADVYDREGEVAAQRLARTWQMKVRPGGLVPVILEPHVGEDAKSINPAILERLGGTIDAVSRSYIRALVPFRFLRRIATHPDVRLVRAATPLKTLEPRD